MAHVTDDFREIHLQYSTLKSMLSKNEMKLENMRTVLVHEIGHLLGLAHSKENAAIMNEKFSMNRTDSLDKDDQYGVEHIYGKVGRNLKLVSTATAVALTKSPTEVASFVECMSLCQNDNQSGRGGGCLIASYQHSTKLCHQYLQANFTTVNESDWTTVANSSLTDHLFNYEPHENVKIFNNYEEKFKVIDHLYCLEKCTQNVNCTAVTYRVIVNEENCFLIINMTNLLAAKNQTGWISFVKQATNQNTNKPIASIRFEKFNIQAVDRISLANVLVADATSIEDCWLKCIQKSLNEECILFSFSNKTKTKNCYYLLNDSGDSNDFVTFFKSGNKKLEFSDNKIIVNETQDLNQLKGVLKRTLTGHVWVVHALAVLQNGKDLVSCSNDNTIKIWNLEDGVCKRTLIGHIRGVHALAVLRNGNLASGSSDQTIKIWNPNDGTLQRTIATGSNAYVYSLVALKNLDDDLASGYNDSIIKIWSPHDGTLKRTLRGHTHQINVLIVLKNGDLVSGSGEGSIKIWNPNNGSLIRTLIGHEKSVCALAALRDGSIVSGSV